MAPNYGLIISVGAVVFTVLTVAMAIIAMCPSQLEDRQSTHFRTSPGIPPRRRRFKGHWRLRHSEFTPLLEDHDHAATLRSASGPDLESQSRVDGKARVAALDNPRLVVAKPPNNEAKRYQAMDSPLPRPGDDHILDRISEEGSSLGQPGSRDCPGSQSSAGLTQEQQGQDNERLENHRKVHDFLENSAAAAEAEHDSSSRSGSGSSASSRSNAAERRENELRSSRLAGHSIGAQECHCAYCLARLQAV